MKRSIVVAALGAAILTTSAQASPLGLWSMTNGKATVRIAPCGATYCAILVGLRKPLDKHGRAKVDKFNPSPSKRSRPVIGLSLVTGLKQDGADWTGKFYNPDDGRTYDGRISQPSENKLSLRGCIISMFCKTQELTRLE